MNDRRGDAASACLFLLLLVVPFEPRFTLPLGLFRLSLVEAVALPCFAVLALGSVGSGWRGQRSPSLVALGLMVTASLFSASLAATDPGRALKFALRLGAMTTFAVLVARRDESELNWGFRALALSGSSAALLALLEGGGVRSLDVFLGVFREIPFNVAGVRRASAGSEYPNPGAGMILYALLSGVTLLRARPWIRALFVLMVTWGLAFTYSRGAWLAGAAGLVVAAWFESGRVRFAPLAVYLGVLGLFVGHEETSRIRFGGENANDFYAAVYEAPGRIAMDPSARMLVPVTVRNVGRKPWRTSDEIHLSYHLYQDPRRPLVDGPRTNLPRDVLPGEAVSIEAILRAPLRPGEYLLMWDLVHEDTTWFSGQGVRPGVARLIVGAGSESLPAASEDEALKAIPDTLAWRPSRLELWRIAVRMWAENPFFGAGPDNYRWTYGTMVGKTDLRHPCVRQQHVPRVRGHPGHVRSQRLHGFAGLRSSCGRARRSSIDPGPHRPFHPGRHDGPRPDGLSPRLHRPLSGVRFRRRRVVRVAPDPEPRQEVKSRVAD